MTASGEFAQSEKQTQIMGAILAAADAGAFHDYQTLQAALPWTKNKPREAARSLLKCSMRFLQKWGMVSVTYAKDRRAIFVPTALAYGTFRRTPTVEDLGIPGPISLKKK